MAAVIIVLYSRCPEKLPVGVKRLSANIVKSRSAVDEISRPHGDIIHVYWSVCSFQLHRSSRVGDRFPASVVFIYSDRYFLINFVFLCFVSVCVHHVNF